MRPLLRMKEKKKKKILVDFWRKPWTDSSYHRTEKISYDDVEVFIQAGYQLSDGLKTKDKGGRDIPVYVRFHHFHKCNYIIGFTDVNGNVCTGDVEGAYPQPKDTASTLADYLASDAMENFKRGMLSKVSSLNEMDMKKIGMIAIIGLGAGLGIFMLMSGGG